MIRFIVYLAIAIGLVWFATSVQLGKHTLVGHVRAIWHTGEVQDLKEGIEEKAAPAVNRLEHGAQAGIHAVTSSGSDNSSGSAAEAK